MNNERKRVEEGAPPLTNELRASLVNQLIEAGGRVVWEWHDVAEYNPQTDTVWATDFNQGNHFLLEDGETPEKFNRPLGV